MTTAIGVPGLTKHYAGATVVRDVSFMVEHGEIFGVIGPKGGGKTTTVEGKEGRRKPDAGHLSVLGLAAPFGAAVQTMTDAGPGHWTPLYPLILACYSVAFAVAAALLFRWE